MALRRFAYFLGRDKVPEVEVKPDFNTMLLMNLCRSQGRHRVVEQTIREHRRLTKDDEKSMG